MSPLATWRAALVALVALRLAIPLVALAASGRDLPGFPAYDYAPLNGDSFGFYAAARELIASLGRLGAARLALVSLALVAIALLAVRLWRRDPGRRWLWLSLGGLAAALAAAAVIHEMEPSGSAVVGWSLVWALPMLPFRLAGLLDPDVAFAVGFPLQLIALAVAVVATAYIGLYATGRRAVGLGAAALFALWPLLTRPLAGASAWENGQWNVDVGLHLYTEPLSTALVATAVALLLHPRAARLRLAIAGLALSFAVAVKFANVVFVALALAVAAWRFRRDAVALAAGVAALAPISIAYWPRGYPSLFDDPQSYSQRAWALDYGLRNWSDSLLWSPRTLVVLAPLAVLGALALRRRDALLLLGLLVVATAVLFSFYDVTRFHPRFLYVTLPAVFTFEALGAAVAIARLHDLRAGIAVRSP